MDKRSKRFTIWKSMDAGDLRPFRIIEVTQTVDGPRSRICEGTWKTWREAAEHIRPVDPSIFASHELTILYPDGSKILAREEFYGSDYEAQCRLSDLWNDRTPTNGTGFKGTIRRYGEPKPFDTIG